MNTIEETAQKVADSVFGHYMDARERNNLKAALIEFASSILLNSEQKQERSVATEVKSR